MLNDGLEDECLLHSGVVRAKACLGRCMQVQGVSCGGKSGVYGSHKHFCEGWGDGDAAIIFWVCSIALAFVQGYNLGCSPRRRWFAINGAGIYK